MRSTKYQLLQTTRSALGALLFTSALACIAPVTSHAQITAQLKKKTKAPEPSDIFFQAHLKLRNAKKLEQAGKFKSAWVDYKSALTYYTTLKKAHPLWKSNLVDPRLQKTKSKMEALRPKVARQLEQEAAAAKGLISGDKTLDLTQFESSSPEIDKLAKRVTDFHKDLKKNQARHQKEQTILEAQLMATEGQLKTLELKNEATPEKAALLRKEIKRTEALLLSNKHYQKADRKRLTKHIDQLKIELKEASSAPLKSDLDRYKRELLKTKNEMTIVSSALVQTQAKKQGLIANLNQKQQSLELAQTQIEQLKGQLKEQSNDSVKVVKALYGKLEAAEKLQKSTVAELTQAREQIAELTGQLDTQIQINDELKQNLKLVTQDRDRLNTLMLENPDNRLKKVVAQNLKLIEELKEKKLTIIDVTKNHNENTDRMIKAERDLAVAKERLDQFQKEELATARKIKSMEQMLQESSVIGKNSNLSSIERKEAAEVKKTANKLLNRLRVSQQKLALIKQEVSLRSQDPILLEMCKQNEKGELIVQLTDREKAIISEEKKKGIQLDFQNPDRMDPRQAQQTMIRLQGEVEAIHSVSKRFIGRGKYKEAQGLLFEANELLPNNFTTLMNLGCVTMHMRQLDEAEQNFKDGIVMKKNNPYAHYMLGMCYYKMSQDELAEKSLKHSLSLDKTQSKVHYYLGAIAGSRQSFETATTHFKNALRVDPDMGPSYKALSTLEFLQGNKEKAQDLYQKALSKGLAPDPKHAQKIGIPH